MLSNLIVIGIVYMLGFYHGRNSTTQTPSASSPDSMFELRT